MCGASRLSSLRSAGARLAPLPTSRSTYCFGKGTAHAEKSWRWNVSVGEREAEGTLDVVDDRNQQLGLLVGKEFAKELGLVQDFVRDEVWQGEERLPSVEACGLTHVFVMCARKEKAPTESLAEGEWQVQRKRKSKRWQVPATGPLYRGGDVVRVEGTRKPADETAEGESAHPDGAPEGPTGPSMAGVTAGEKLEQPLRREQLAPEASPKPRRKQHNHPANGTAGANTAGQETGQRKPSGDLTAGVNTAGRAGANTAKPPQRTTLPKDRPRVLALTDKELDKLHRKGHGGVDRLTALLKGCLSRTERKEFSEEWAQLRESVKAAVAKCGQCAEKEPPRKPATSLRPVSERYLESVTADLICLDSKRNLWALGIVDDATAEPGFAVVDDKSAPQAAQAAFLRFFSWRGAPEQLRSDFGREFLGPFIADLTKLGVEVGKTAPYTSGAHGKIERVFETLRHSTDRMKKPKNKREWEIALATIENSIRNEIRVGGYSSSQRATGRSCHLERNLLTDTLPTAKDGAEGEVSRLLELRAEATDAYRQVVHSRKLREALVEKAQPESREYAKGEKVYYFRPGVGGQEVRGRTWLGPATVIGFEPTEKVHTVSHGGMTVHVGWRHMRGVNEMRVGKKEAEKAEFAVERPKEREMQNAEGEVQKDPEAKVELAEVAEAKEERVRRKERAGRAETSLPGNVAGSGRDAPGGTRCGAEQGGARREGDAELDVRNSEDQHEATHEPQEVRAHGPGGAHATEDYDIATPPTSPRPPPKRTPPPLRRSARLKTLVRLAIATVERKAHPEPIEKGLMSTDHYAFRWEDVSEEQKRLARARAIEDYDSHDAWDRGDEGTKGELRAFWEGQGVRATFLDGRHVDKPKIYGGDLCGRSRWTPKGFMQTGPVDKESPTLSDTANIMMENGGISRGHVKVVFDWSEAFFNSDKLPEEEPPLYVEIPPEEQYGEKKYRRLLKAVPGTQQGPREFFETAKSRLLEQGLEQSGLDPCLFRIRNELDPTVLDGEVGLHVDDGKAWVCEGVSTTGKHGCVRGRWSGFAA